MSDPRPLLKPKEIKITDGEGKERTFTISKFDAVEGREIVMKYPLAALPKVGDYQVSEETMLKLMNYVAVEKEGTMIRLGSRALINNHVGDWESLAKLEKEMMQYNCSFFTNGSLSSLLDDLAQKFLQRISEILTPLSAQSSPAEKLPSTSSEPSTT